MCEARISRGRSWMSVCVIGLLICMPGVWLTGCLQRGPIRVGFAGELTGKHSDLGVHGRNAALLAVETINAAGGIAGRPIELLVRDDLGTPEGARSADRELIDADVVAILGHMTSVQSLAALPVIEEAGVVLLSPTTSTVDLSGLDDHFFRVVSTNAQEASILARHIYERRGLSRLVVVYDSDNAAFTESFLRAFLETYHTLGGQAVQEARFSSTAADLNLTSVVSDLQMSDAEGMLIIASAYDSAFIAQQTRINGWQVPLFVSGWAYTEALLQNGGQAVEGLELVTPYNSSSQSELFLDFQERYQERFGRVPTFGAVFAYDAVLVLAAALEKTGGGAEGLPQALCETQRFQGLVSTISLDEYGDAVRTHFLSTVQDGEFVISMALEPEGIP